MLTYYAETLLPPSFSALLAADLDEDARLFYSRAASDISVLAAAVDRPSDAAAIIRTLLQALAAAPAARPACWRRLYRELSVLVRGCDVEAVPRNARPELARLRGFLAENVDLGDRPAIEDLERKVLGHAAGA